MARPQRFQDAVVVVTGATSGIGASLARAFAAEGAQVVGTGRDQARLMDLAGRIALPLTLDLTRQRSVDAVAQTVLDRFGRVDVLVHNAGIGQFRTWSDTAVDDIQKVMDVNLYGAVRLTRALLPAMVERGDGVVCSIASVAGERGYPKHTAYCASKHALIGWSRALQKDLRGTGVDVVIVCPPAVDTPFFENAGFADYKAQHPGLALMHPDAVAAGTLDAVQRRAGQVILSPRARVLWLLDKLAPPVVERLQRWKDSR
ncbi:MAG: SDR family NAD(P)-dependent oxidoreductase [Alphaproteobacteria bacterium]|nr:SDR family NAD(P)-dependent oxidoreductase [Alphaproteobacteria bacterium]